MDAISLVLLLVITNVPTSTELERNASNFYLSGVQVPNGNRDAELLLNELREQVFLYTQAMDLEVDEDREVYSRIIAHFPAKMTSYLHAVKLESTQVDHSFLCDLVSAVHWLKFNAIKDRFNAGKRVSVDHELFQRLAPWAVDLLSYTLSEHSHWFNVNASSCEGKLTPLELAVKLQMINSVELLLEKGAVVCENGEQPICNSALLLAVTTQNFKILQILLNVIKEINSVTVSSQQSGFHSDTWKILNPSPLQASSLICWSGLGCECYNSLTSLLRHSYTHDVSKELLGISVPRALQELIYTGTCPHRVNMRNYERIDITNTFTSIFPLTDSNGAEPICGPRILDSGGWRVYENDVFAGRINEGCQLPQVSLGTISTNDFESIFIKMRSVYIPKVDTVFPRIVTASRIVTTHVSIELAL